MRYFDQNYGPSALRATQLYNFPAWTDVTKSVHQENDDNMALERALHHPGSDVAAAAMAKAALEKRKQRATRKAKLEGMEKRWWDPKVSERKLFLFNEELRAAPRKRQQLLEMQKQLSAAIVEVDSHLAVTPQRLRSAQTAGGGKSQTGRSVKSDDRVGV